MESPSKSDLIRELVSALEPSLPEGGNTVQGDLKTHVGNLLLQDLERCSVPVLEVLLIAVLITDKELA